MTLPVVSVVDCFDASSTIRMTGPRRRPNTVRSEPNRATSTPRTVQGPGSQVRSCAARIRDGGNSTSSPMSGKSPRTFDVNRGDSTPQRRILSATHSQSSISGRSPSGTNSSDGLRPSSANSSASCGCAATCSAVKFGVSSPEIWIVFQPEPGLHTEANSVAGSSGLPIARIRQSLFVVIASTAVHNWAGTPQASSRMTSTYRRWMPWKPCSSVSAGLRPKPIRVPSSSFHSSDWRTLPGRGSPRPAAFFAAARISSHRIAWTCL